MLSPDNNNSLKMFSGTYQQAELLNKFLKRLSVFLIFKFYVKIFTDEHKLFRMSMQMVERLLGDLAADDSIRKKKITFQYCLQFLTVFEVYLYIITKYGTNILWAGGERSLHGRCVFKEVMTIIFF
jgi:hypothetical protein